MQDTIAKFKEEKRAEWKKSEKFAYLMDCPSMIDESDMVGIADYFLSKIPELLTLLEDQVGEDLLEVGFSSMRIFEKEIINQERARIRNLLSLTKQQF